MKCTKIAEECRKSCEVHYLLPWKQKPGHCDVIRATCCVHLTNTSINITPTRISINISFDAHDQLETTRPWPKNENKLLKLFNLIRSIRTKNSIEVLSYSFMKTGYNNHTLFEPMIKIINYKIIIMNICIFVTYLFSYYI